ncbi:type II toxin-antitoxin system VapC family toxin [Cerasicoccus frondis]|uniref:type II toxin-antitoxin system VapC family toxin n=1 Tax=Cerasicoccus frondis TaxID=490090 RepID=UPI0028526C5C|nr:PIN domain nuclease [Cerasicoccus frondis]
MVIVDTTVWIHFLQGRETGEVAKLEALLADEVDVFITGLIIQEILTGIKAKKDRAKVIKELSHFILINPTLETHIQAAEIFDACRKKGLTIRSIIDCLIAALALEYDLAVLEKGRDYSFIAEVFPLKNFR